MPGPQFNQDGPEKSWLARHSSKIVIAVIVILLAIGGGYFYKSYQQRKAVLKPALENIMSPSAMPSPVPSPTGSPSTAKTPGAKIFSPAISPTPQPPPTIGMPGAVPEIKKTDNEIVATAVKGNGLTHLARYALKEYLKEKPELAGQLKAEHKIYIEDYLQKHTAHSKILKVGDEISFSNELIKEAIDQAQKLTDSQIKNLGQYVPLVPSLMTI